MTSFSKLFWGFIIVLLDFRIQSFDILPDIIGYLMIYSGLEQLTFLNDHFKWAKKYSVFLAFISFFDIIQLQPPSLTISMNPVSTISFLIGIVIIISNLGLVYHICNGIAISANERHNYELEKLSLNRWKYYLAANIALLVATPLMIIYQNLQVVIGIPLLVFANIIMVLIVLLMKKSGEILLAPKL